jgi:hypothetical protein
MLDKLKGSWYHKGVIERLSLSLNQAVGVDRPELKPLERSKILNEGGSLQEGGGHRVIGSLIHSPNLREEVMLVNSWTLPEVFVQKTDHVV